MWKKIKIFGGIIAAAAVVGLLFIPNTKSYSDGKIHLRYWFVTGTKEQIPYHVSEFNKIQNKIVVEPTPLPWNEHEKKILTSIVSEDPPDIINLVSPVAKWATRMALLPLDKLINKDSFDTTQFFPALWKEMKWQNHIFAIPLYSNSYAFFYNKKLFREAGLDPNNPPKTWEEVKEYSKLLTRKDSKGKLTQMGFIPQYGNLSTAMLMAWELGAKFLIENKTKVNLANPEMVKALQWVVNFYNDYSYDEVSSFMAGFGYADQHGFISGKVAMMVLDNTFIDQIKIYKPNLDYGVAIIPSFKGYQTASSSGSWWIAVPRGSKHLKEAWEFMKFSVQKDVQLAEAESQKEILYPANQRAAKDPQFIKNNNVTKIFIKEMDYAHSPAVVPMAHDVFWREFFNARERALRKIQTPQKALKQANEVIQRELTEAIEYNNYVMKKMKISEN